MASVKKRRFEGGIAWYGKYDAGKDENGKTIWKVIKTGQPTRTTAAAWITAHEREERRKRESKTVGELGPDWLKEITNRNADDDETRFNLHVLPFFKDTPLVDVKQELILEWVAKQRRTPKRRGKGNLSDATVRHHLNLLSRFLSWCTPKYIAANPVRAIETGKRPKQSKKLADAPWIEDDKTVRDIYNALPSPFGLMFYIGNRSGMRLGEICGLRLSSFDTMDEGTIRVRWTYDDGYLKEDKDREGKSKPVPASEDLPALLKPWIDRRKAEGATGESLMFPNPKNEGKAYRRLAVERAWVKACVAAKFCRPHPDDGDKPEDKRRQLPICTFYEGTRHSFASRVLKQTRGKALYEVSKALGHHDVSVTARHYARWIMSSFSDALRGGLDMKPTAELAPVIPIRPEGTAVGTYVQNGSAKGKKKAPETLVASRASVSDPSGN